MVLSATDRAQSAPPRQRKSRWRLHLQRGTRSRTIDSIMAGVLLERGVTSIPAQPGRHPRVAGALGYRTNSTWCFPPRAQRMPITPSSVVPDAVAAHRSSGMGSPTDRSETHAEYGADLHPMLAPLPADGPLRTVARATNGGRKRAPDTMSCPAENMPRGDAAAPRRRGTPERDREAGAFTLIMQPLGASRAPPGLARHEWISRRATSSRSGDISALAVSQSGVTDERGTHYLYTPMKHVAQSHVVMRRVDTRLFFVRRDVADASRRSVQTR